MKTPVLLVLMPLLASTPVLAQVSPDQPLRCTPRAPYVAGDGRLVTTDTMLCRPTPEQPVYDNPRRPDWRRFDRPGRDWRTEPILRRPLHPPSPYNREAQQ